MGLERAFSVSDGGLGEEETKSRPCCSIAVLQARSQVHVLAIGPSGGRSTTCCICSLHIEYAVSGLLRDMHMVVVGGTAFRCTQTRPMRDRLSRRTTSSTVKDAPSRWFR